MKQKYKYIYDKKTNRLLKKINEDDNSTTTNTNQEQQQNQNQQNQQNTSTGTTTETPKGQSIDSNPDMQKLNQEFFLLKTKYDNDINTQNKLLNAAKQAASKKTEIGPYDPVMTDTNVINIMKKINMLNRQFYINSCNYEDKKIALLTKLSQLKENYYKIPEKYKGLNESNIHTAKIYMKNLIDQDHILKGMVDFKRVFKDTNLLYGKDREGYFIVALDSDDFNQATEALEEVGYLRDEILDTIMPQVLDRHTMIQ